MVVLGCWVIFSGVVAWVAAERGRGPIAWFLIALLISPVLGCLLLLMVPCRPIRSSEALASQERADPKRQLAVNLASFKIAAVGLAICAAVILVAATTAAHGPSAAKAAARPSSPQDEVAQAKLLYPFALDGAITLRKTRQYPDGLQLFRVRVRQAPDGRGIACYAYRRKRDANDPDDKYWFDVRLGNDYRDESQGQSFYSFASKECPKGAGVDVTQKVLAGLKQYDARH